MRKVLCRLLVACCAAAAFSNSSSAQAIDTDAWVARAGQPVSAAASGLASFSSPGATFGVEGAGGGGNGGARAFVRGAPGQPLTFRVNPPSAMPGDIARVWFSLRAQRSPGAAFPGTPSFRLHQLPSTLLRTTVYLKDDQPADTPSGSPAKPPGLAFHAQSFLAGTNVDSSLVFTEYNIGYPVMAFNQWASVELEIVRSDDGRYITLINGVPVSGVVHQYTSWLAASDIDDSLEMSLPAIDGLSWQLGGPIGSSGDAHVYERLGTTYPEPTSVARMLAIPATLDVPWSPFLSSTSDAVTLRTDTFSTTGLTVDHRRLIVEAHDGGSATVWTEPLGSVSGRSTLLIRDVFVSAGASMEITVGHAGAQTTRLKIQNGQLLGPDLQPLLEWRHDCRYMVLIHLNADSINGERSVSLVNLSAETMQEPILTSAPLVDLGSPVNELSVVTLATQIPGAGGSTEFGGVAVCRRVDMMMVDSYVSAFTQVPAPKLVSLSQLGRVFFSGVDVDLVPGRPTLADQHADAPMALIPLGRAGGRLSHFLGASGEGAAYTRGARFILNGGYVNELTVWPQDTYLVDSFENATRRADEVATALRTFVQLAVDGSNEVVIGTPVAVPYYESDPYRSASFAAYTQRLRALASDFRSTGRVRIADADAELKASEKDALFGPDRVHFSASGCIVYARMLAECMRGPVQCGPADLGQSGGRGGHDGVLDNNDFIAFIDLFFAGEPEADQGVAGGLAGHDGQLDSNDFIAFIAAFFGGG